MESYYTIQGEGFHQGKAAWFIRLGGCDVGCVWCDVKESWDASKYYEIPINEITNQAANCKSEIMVVTGGEPLMYNLDQLCNALHQKKKKIHLETSGAYPITGKWDWICLSPKKFKPPLNEIIPLAHELKVIIYNRSDFKWAEQFVSKTNMDCKLFLQPEWSCEKKIMPLIVNYIKDNPKWNLSLQIHKYLNIP